MHSLDSKQFAYTAAKWTVPVINCLINTAKKNIIMQEVSMGAFIATAKAFKTTTYPQINFNPVWIISPLKY